MLPPQTRQVLCVLSFAPGSEGGRGFRYGASAMPPGSSGHIPPLDGYLAEVHQGTAIEGALRTPR